MLAVVNIPWLHKEKANTSFEGAMYAAYDVIGSGNPALAQRIHDQSDGPPPFAATLHKGVLRIGCLTSDVFLAVANSSLAYKAQRERFDTFDSILEKAQAMQSDTIKLRFISPTSFGKHGITHVMPEPRRLFNSLAQRWSQYGGPPVPAYPDLSFDDVSVLAMNLRSRRVRMNKYTGYGSVGYAIYKVPPGSACWCHALALFAEYSGVGQRTSHGFGRVAVDPPG